MSTKPDSPLPPLLARDMTLRDYVALVALRAFLRNDETEMSEDVADAYVVADLMLSERAK